MVLGSGIRDPRSGIRKKSIPDPGSRIQGSKSTQSRIPDPDPQHWRQHQKSVDLFKHIPLKTPHIHITKFKNIRSVLYLNFQHQKDNTNSIFYLRNMKGSEVPRKTLAFSVTALLPTTKPGSLKLNKFQNNNCYFKKVYLYLDYLG
jgi:hypothetical protein